MQHILEKTSTMFCIVPNITLSLIYKHENDSGVSSHEKLKTLSLRFHFLQ